jgi:hypothetical protein
MKKNLLHIATIVALIASPGITLGQAPSLGSTAGFVLFTSIGAVGNTGTSHLTGHVGTNNGAITGFGNVNGNMNNSNGASALCATDLLTAYNQLNASIATLFPAPLLGNGQSLNAGIYSISGNSTLNNTLTLDGQNNSSAVFIIKIQGSFSANAGSQVVLINSAKACNVFWKIEGLVSMAAGSTMRGTIIANNAAITMNTGCKLEGRALSTSGAITINGVVADTPVGCGSPYLTGPASPTLNSVGCYALFSSNGPVTNAGVTFVNGGDIGTNVGLTTGFNALNVTGAIHPIPDGSTGACVPDLLNVYNYLNTLPYDIELLYPAQFGNKLVLTPHVYRLNGATTFNDTLFLNGMGNANAVFVIQANGAIGTSTYAKVILTNGTQAKNVFWKVNGALNINNYSDMIGTIICNNGAISLGSGVTLLGRALTTNGAMSTAAISVTVTPGCSLMAPNIVSQPVNKTICSGNSVSYMVTATGSGLIYKWRKGAANLTNGGNISGATTATLTINPATVTDVANNYNVIISGPYAPADTSNSVALAVNLSPSITTQPSNQIACESSSASFSVAAVGANMTYAWRKGIVFLVNGGNISGATSPILIINPVNVTDTASNYNVVITGTCSPSGISSNASLVLCNMTGLASLNETNAPELAAFYPNPFTNSLYMAINDASYNNCELTLYNVLGAEVINIPILKKTTAIETNNLPSGIYFYRISDSKKVVQSGKLISAQ